MTLCEGRGRRAILRAALFAGATFETMRHSADLDDDEVLDSLPSLERAPHAYNRAWRVALLAILVTNDDEAHVFIREVLHGGKSNASVEDLRRLGTLLESVADAVLTNTALGFEDIRALTAEWLGIATATQRRAAVVQSVFNRAGPDATDTDARSLIEELSHYDSRFSGLDAIAVREVLARTVPDENAGGTRSDGAGYLSEQGAAAKLSVMVRAFGDTDVGRSKALYREAMKASEKGLRDRQQRAIAENRKCKL